MTDFLQGKKIHWLIWLTIIGAYFLSHLISLTKLPVFADEAIYIRWSQLIIDDWQRYLFFPLNDGKTPLHMWLMVPFIKLLPDPLWAARFLSVLAGAAQLIVVQRIIKKLDGKILAQVTGMVIVTALPFWFFYHRMALIDGLLTLWISGTVLGLVNVAKINWDKKGSIKNKFFWVGFTGVSLGLALLTKLPAIFILPIFPLFTFLHIKKVSVLSSQFWKRLVIVGVAAGIGTAMFGLLKLHPAFGQLFSRGQDFTFTTQEILRGEWRTSLNNYWRMFFWHGSYMSYIFTLLAGVAIFLTQKPRKYLILFLSAAIFITPFAVYGRVLSPRYVMPMLVFTTVAVSLFLEELFFEWKKVRWAFWVLLIPPTFLAARFFISSWTNIDTLAFVPVDRTQYLEEWSSGQGIREMVDIIEEQAKQGRVLVATEGYFGTLPDGLLMYFHNRKVDNIEIIGIGQPIIRLPEELLEKSRQSDTTYLVVNSHRLLIKKDYRLHLVQSFSRPGKAPSLLVYEIKE